MDGNLAETDKGDRLRKPSVSTPFSINMAFCRRTLEFCVTHDNSPALDQDHDGNAQRRKHGNKHRIGSVNSAVGVKRKHELSDTWTWDEAAECVGYVVTANVDFQTGAVQARPIREARQSRACEPMRSYCRHHAAWASKVLERGKAEVFKGGKGDDKTVEGRWDGDWGLS